MANLLPPSMWLLIEALVLSMDVLNSSLKLSLQPFSQDYNLTALITPVAGVNFIHKCRDLQFNVKFLLLELLPEDC